MTFLAHEFLILLILETVQYYLNLKLWELL